MDRYVVDTHALVWYLANDSRIGSKAKSLLYRCDAGDIQVIVPAIVLIESISIITNPRKEIRGQRPSVDALFLWLENNPQFIVSPLDYRIVRAFETQLPLLRSLRDDHDRLIVITSKILDNIPIITRDLLITGVAQTIW